MKKHTTIGLSLATAALAVASVTAAPAAATGFAGSSAASADVRAAVRSAEGVAADWSYSGATGPEHWGSIAPACAPSSTGSQSPINIEFSRLVESKKVVEPSIRYKASSFISENAGFTADAAPVGGGNTVTVDGKSFSLKQFHVHAPSEHEINGKRAAMELHFVNASADGSLAVVGVLFEIGAENKHLAEFFTNLPAAPHSSVALKKQINPAKIIPANADFVRYSGSLTTPPCSEGVLWNVADKPATLSKAQLDAFTAVFDDNSRPVQALNNRSVFEAQD